MSTPGNNVIHTKSSIQVTTRRDRSFYTCIIQAITRPFRQYLGRPSKEAQPAGSPELSPHKSAYKGVNVTHRTVCDIHVYDIISKKPATQIERKRIYYFSGGGWQSPPSSQHWHNTAKVHDPASRPA
jgi:acetyl esterase/lipase